jgi:hypothetical protein
MQRMIVCRNSMPRPAQHTPEHPLRLLDKPQASSKLTSTKAKAVHQMLLRAATAVGHMQQRSTSQRLSCNTVHSSGCASQVKVLLNIRATPAVQQ